MEFEVRIMWLLIQALPTLPWLYSTGTLNSPSLHVLVIKLEILVQIKML